MAIKLEKKIFIRGEIKLLTGLTIGGGSPEYQIGGTDKIIIRDPISGEPYIPGSSLKGKMRSLLEKLLLDYDWYPKENYNGPSKIQEKRSGRLFGTPEEKMPSRVIIRDAFLTEESKLELQNAETDLPFTEIKAEVALDRITSKPPFGPRYIERVPAGAKFAFEMVLNILTGDNEEELLQDLFKAMELLQDDYLGGFGSRGYGKVKFHIESLTFKSKDQYENHEGEKPYEAEIPESLK